MIELHWVKTTGEFGEVRTAHYGTDKWFKVMELPDSKILLTDESNRKSYFYSDDIDTVVGFCNFAYKKVQEQKNGPVELDKDQIIKELRKSLKDLMKAMRTVYPDVDTTKLRQPYDHPIAAYDRAEELMDRLDR